MGLNRTAQGLLTGRESLLTGREVWIKLSDLRTRSWQLFHAFTGVSRAVRNSSLAVRGDKTVHNGFLRFLANKLGFAYIYGPCWTYEIVVLNLVSSPKP